jgi:hypothetical protein
MADWQHEEKVSCFRRIPQADGSLLLAIRQCRSIAEAPRLRDPALSAIRQLRWIDPGKFRKVWSTSGSRVFRSESPENAGFRTMGGAKL